MISAYEQLQDSLRQTPQNWLVTGVAGFIGSNLLQKLLELNQFVIGLDNFSTGHHENLEDVRGALTPAQWQRARIIEGDICDLETCRQACRDVQLVLHQAALGSVPRSMADPIRTHQNNVDGFLNMLVAARDAKVSRFVYASSSSVYGDSPELPKVEERTGQPLSPYAATKAMNELYAGVFGRSFGLDSIGLRYFNVFGPRQDPAGAYAAVVPRWIAALLQAGPVHIYGDGQTSRDFSFIENVVQANLLAATTSNPAARSQAFNIAVGEATTLKQLFHLIQSALRRREPSLPEQTPIHKEFRAGDVRHSLASIEKAKTLLGYVPTHNVQQGLDLAMEWYCRPFLFPKRTALDTAASQSPATAIAA